MIQKTYKAYLFDFDYTLADSSRGIVMCFRNVLAMHGHDGISDEAIKRTIGKTRGSRNLVGITIQLSNSEEKELFIRYSMQISSE